MFQFNNNNNSQASSSSMMSSSSSMLLCDDNGITSQVELSFSCSNLVNLDILSKSDPQVIVYTRIPASNNNNNKNSNGKNHSRSNSVYNNGNNNNNSSRSGVWHEIGRTEIIWDNLNPKFVKTFILNYRFECMCFLLSLSFACDLQVFFS